MSRYTVEETRISKDHWGKWTAKTAILFAGEVLDSMKRPTQRVLNISTYKTDRGMLMTTASVALRGDHFESHVMSFGEGGDFSKRVMLTPMKRVTEKDIRNQHAGALITDLPGLIAQVEAYYMAQDNNRLAQDNNRLALEMDKRRQARAEASYPEAQARLDKADRNDPAEMAMARAAVNKALHG